jgi:hypothetical protein
MTGSIYVVSPDNIGSAVKELCTHHPLTNLVDNPFGDLYIIYSGAVLGPNGINIHNVDIDQMRRYLTAEIKASSLVVFDDTHEGMFLFFMLDKIHAIINGTNINPSSLTYISNTVNSAEIFTCYYAIHPQPPINVIGYNQWEMAVAARRRCLAEINYVAKKRDKLFLCFNRMLKPHRLALLGLLQSKGLVEKASYSFFLHCYSTREIPMDEAIAPVRITFPKNAEIIKTALEGIKLPLLLNIKNTDNKNYLDDDDIPLFENSYFSLVTETTYSKYMPNQPLYTIFFSEKIFKPIFMKHPFILVSAPRALSYLRKIGYKTFSPFIDESYDFIEDDEDRMVAIVNEVSRLSDFSTDQWITWQQHIKEIVEFNRNILLTRKQNEYIYNRSPA